MNEIERDFHSDCFSKKNIARSARYKRTHTGKGGRVRLPHDNLTKKELEKMNGEVKAYRLNDPMTWEEFKELPDDLKETYIKLLREKFDVSTAHIADMFGVSTWSLGNILRTLGLSEPKGTRHHAQEDAWSKWRGKIKTAEPVEADTCENAGPSEEEPINYEALIRQADESIRDLSEVNEGLRREVDRLRAENTELMAVAPDPKDFVSRDWHNKIVDTLEKDNELLRAKMSVVEMIFGNKRC